MPPIDYYYVGTGTNPNIWAAGFSLSDGGVGGLTPGDGDNVNFTANSPSITINEPHAAHDMPCYLATRTITLNADLTLSGVFDSKGNNIVVGAGNIYAANGNGDLSGACNFSGWTGRVIWNGTGGAASYIGINPPFSSPSKAPNIEVAITGGGAQAVDESWFVHNLTITSGTVFTLFNSTDNPIVVYNNLNLLATGGISHAGAVTVDGIATISGDLSNYTGTITLPANTQIPSTTNLSGCTINIPTPSGKTGGTITNVVASSGYLAVINGTDGGGNTNVIFYTPPSGAVASKNFMMMGVG